MSALKDTLQSDLTSAIKSRDELTAATIRMVLTAITNEEVAGKEARQLSDDDVLTVLGREAKKRRESAEAYDAAARPELAARERDELGVIARYLPQQMGDDEVQTIVDAAVAEVAASGATGGQAMGAVMKLVQPQLKGRADGGVVAAKVKSALGLS
ncbi:MAG: GatB/YqeY domain-containing protein [Actinomycetes bacterium]